MPIDHEAISAEVKLRFACTHITTEVRTKTDKAGRLLVARQCVRCGQQQGSYLPRKQYSSPQIAALPKWDTTLEHSHRAQLADATHSRFENEKIKEREAFLNRHAAYLKSDIWRRLRKKVLERADYICEGCAEAKATQVHHLNYTRWGGNELLIDLLAVCDECHAKLHPKDKHPVDILIESRNLPENNRGAFFEGISLPR